MKRVKTLPETDMIRLTSDLRNQSAIKLERLCKFRAETFHLRKFKRQILGDAIDMLYEHEMGDVDEE